MDELIPILGIVFTIGVPSVALATHFVLRPMVRDIIGAIRSNKQVEGEDVLARIARLEEEFFHLDKRVDSLLEAERFRRELGSSPQDQ